MRVISTRVDDWLAAEVEKLGKPADVLRNAVLAYLSNKLGYCEDMALIGTKITAFKDVFAEVADLYREFVSVRDEMKNLVYSSAKPFSTTKFADLGTRVKKFFAGNELGKYLDLAIEFLNTLKTGRDPYREFDLVIEKAVREFEDAKNDYEYIRNHTYLFDIEDVRTIVDELFAGMPPSGVEAMREETVRAAIKIRFDIFSRMDMKRAAEFAEFAEKADGGLKVLREICGGRNADFRVPLEVCSAYDRIVTNYRELYLADIADIAERYGLSGNDVIAKAAPAILGEDVKYGRFDMGATRAALGLVILDGFVLGMFDLSAKNPEVLFAARLYTDLEKARRKICMQ